MTVVFFCQSCGSRFDVDARLAGKTGSCRKCGQRFKIPQPDQIASMTAMPAVAVQGAARAATLEPARPAAPSATDGAFSASMVSHADLAPLTMVNLRRGMKPPPKLDPLADASNSALYAVVETRRKLLPVGRPKQGSAVNMLWRKELGGVQKVLRWLGDTAYLISVPFLILILFGAGMKNRPLALFGATVAIALNIGRLATGLFNMIVIHFRQGPIKGVLFLIPPMTVYYLATGWSTMQKSVGRIVEPAITIGLVVAAFLFIPWLRRGDVEDASLSDRVRAQAGALEEDLRGEVAKAKDLDLQQLKQQGQAKFDELRNRLGREGEPGAATATEGQTPSVEQEIGTKLKGIQEQIRKQVGDTPNQP